jgi:hypothetical protein
VKAALKRVGMSGKFARVRALSTRYRYRAVDAYASLNRRADGKSRSRASIRPRRT